MANNNEHPETKVVAKSQLSFSMIVLFAIASGLSVANIYFAQPLLDEMAYDLGIAPAIIGIVITVTQIGYALGLILIVPLGDLLDRRRLIVGQAILSAIALIGVGLAPTATILLVGMLLVGLLAVVVQVLVAFTATLATPAERGRAVGMVTSGIVTGILLARFFSGLLADLGGWRTVYLTSAVLTLGMAALLYRILPEQKPHEDQASYRALIWSTILLFVEEPVLRIRAAFAFLIFATFSTFWTSIVLPLSAPPFSMSHTAIGMLGLAGLAGAVAASGTGHLADRGFAQQTTGAALALMLLAWIPIAFLSTSLWILVIGVILLDLAVQAVHVTNQSLIFATRPEAPSRLVGGYMVFYSIGSAFGSIASTTIYALTGWTGVCILGSTLSAIGLLFWLATQRCKKPALDTRAVPQGEKY